MISLLTTNPGLFISYLIALLIAITVHEFSHAYVAERLGDPTPRLQGRVSLNPLSHLDPFGILFLLFFGFGWGKPVQFDPFNLKEPRRDAALISLAGPGANFVLAIILSFILRIVPDSSFQILAPIIYINVLLGVFNFLPVAPLDGFKIVGGLLSSQKARDWYSLERYGIIFLLLLLLPVGGSNMLANIIHPIINFMMGLLLPASLIGGGII